MTRSTTTAFVSKSSASAQSTTVRVPSLTRKLQQKLRGWLRAARCARSLTCVTPTGEMCTCRAGYVNRNGRCARVSY